MRSRRISKRVLASPVGVVNDGDWGYLPPLIVRASYGRGRAVAGDGHNDSCLSTRTIVATPIQCPRIPRHNGGDPFE
ncbi:hypothetical protein AVEN_204822-1, partial [Araneus ventricosus]